MKISRRRFIRSTASCAVTGAFTASGGYYYGRRLETEWLESKTIEIPMLPPESGLNGFRILLLSDFHLYPHTRLEFVERVVQRGIELSPDLVALTGDFVQASADAIFDLAPVLARLNPALGTFCVMGNHDVWKGREVVESGLRSEGLEVLNNRGITLTRGRDSFYLAGVDDCWSGSPDLDAAMAGCPADSPVILLSHEPDPADEYCRDPRIGLQLSGHSHGGQVRIPWFGSPFLPPFGRKYDRGLYRVSDMWLYTNCGVGVTVPVRLNCRPEVTEVILAGRQSRA